MIELGVTYFGQLAALAQDSETGFQYVRLGNWLDRKAGDQAIESFPDKKFLYHHNGNIRANEPETQALIAAFRDRQRQTNCPWLSAHLDHHTDAEINSLLQGGTRPPRYEAGQALELIRHAIQSMQAHLPVPLLLENMQHWPLPEADVAVAPAFITRVLEETQSGLLLDTAHARITAAVLNRSVRSYLEELPLERTVEIHVSSPRLENGQWVSCHEAMQEEDYTLLEWLLERVTPKVITLEYWKDAAQARQQIRRLDQLIAQLRPA
jgi:uncharacterized protein (UPF0276 family)